MLYPSMDANLMGTALTDSQASSSDQADPKRRRTEYPGPSGALPPGTSAPHYIPPPMLPMAGYGPPFGGPMPPPFAGAHLQRGSLPPGMPPTMLTQPPPSRALMVPPPF